MGQALPPQGFAHNVLSAWNPLPLGSSPEYLFNHALGLSLNVTSQRGLS